MSVTTGRSLQIGDLRNYVLFAPVRQTKDKGLKAVSKQNQELYKNGYRLFEDRLQNAGLNSPIISRLPNLDDEVSAEWCRVKKEENRHGIYNRVHFLAGVPFKVGIWMDRKGRFTDLRFGHWGIHSLHVGSTIFAQAHAVAFMIPYDERHIPWKAYFIDLSPRIRNSIKAWFGRYADAHKFYANLDNYFGVPPFVQNYLSRHQQINDLLIKSNTAHFDAMRAPLMGLPPQGYRNLPGNDESLRAAPIENDGTYRIFKTSRGDNAPYRRTLSTPVRGVGGGSIARKNAALFEAGLKIYAHKLSARGMYMPDAPAALYPVMTEAEEHWQNESADVLADIKRSIEFKVGVPFKAALWFDTGGCLTNIRFSQWGGYMLHLGASVLGPSDAIAYLIPHREGFAPLRAIVTASYAERSTEEWLHCYGDAQKHYRGLDKKYGVAEFLKTHGSKFRMTNTVCAIAGLCHVQEVHAPLIGFARGTHSGFATNAAANKVILHGENDEWVVGVPEGERVGIDSEVFGEGLHRASWNAVLASGGNVYRLGQGPAGFAWLGTESIVLNR